MKGKNISLLKFKNKNYIFSSSIPPETECHIPTFFTSETKCHFRVAMGRVCPPQGHSQTPLNKKKNCSIFTFKKKKIQKKNQKKKSKKKIEKKHPKKIQSQNRKKKKKKNSKKKNSKNKKRKKEIKKRRRKQKLKNFFQINQINIWKVALRKNLKCGTQIFFRNFFFQIFFSSIFFFKIFFFFFFFRF